MAVNAKGRRKVNVNRQSFIWYVSDEKTQIPDQGFISQEPARILHIISTNKKFIVHYILPNTGDEFAELRVEGPHFPRSPSAKIVQVPRWRHDYKRYPTADFVRRLIGWCLEESGA